MTDFSKSTAGIAENKPKSLKKNAALNMARTVMSLIFPLITFPYVSRVLGPVYIGKVNFAQSVVSYFSLVAALGISTYAIREAAKVRDDKTRLSKFIKEILSINLASTLAAYVLFIVAVLAVPLLSEYRKLLCICGASILFTTLGMDYLYTALEEFRYITVRSVAFQFLSLVLLFTLVKNQNDYLKYAAISVVSSVGSNILNFFHARKFVDFRLAKETKLELKKHLKPIFTFFAMSAAVSIYTVLDTTMLGFLKGDEAVGIYTAATKINRTVIMMITAATGVLLPRLSFYASSGGKSEFLRLADKAVQFVVLFSVPCAAGLFVLAEPAVLVFSGAKYLPAVPVMKIMNAVVVFISLGVLMGGNVLVSAGMEKYSLVATCVGAVVNFSLNMIFIPRLGAEGAAVGTVCAELFVTTTQFICGRKLVNFRHFLLSFLYGGVCSFAMAALVVLLRNIFDSSALQLLVCVPSGAALYLVLLLAFRNPLALELIKILKRRLK